MDKIAKLLAKMFEERKKKGIAAIEVFEPDVIIGVLRYNVYENPGFGYRRYIDNTEWAMLECSEDFRNTFVDCVICDIKMRMLAMGMNPSDYWEV